MVRLAKNRPKNHTRIPATTSDTKSKLVMPTALSGVIDALQPSTKNILNRLLPIALPMANSGFFLIAATIEVAN